MSHSFFHRPFLGVSFLQKKTFSKKATEFKFLDYVQISIEIVVLVIKLDADYKIY